MPSANWKYVENQFDSATRESFKKMHTLGADHDAKLRAATLPEVAPLLARYTPVYAAWKLAYNAWKNATAAHKGGTLAMSNKVDSLTRQVPEEGSPLERWDLQISLKYPPASSKYRGIFPQGRSGISAGTLEERVSALSQLADRVADAGGLPAALVTEIKDFAIAAAGLREAQQTLEGKETAARLALEPQRVDMARMLYKNLGALMDLHAENPAAITGYFDLSVLRSTDSPTPEEPEAPAPPTPPVTP